MYVTVRNMENNPTCRLGATMFASSKRMIRQTRAQTIFGRVENGVHMLEKGIALGNSIYQIGRTLAPLAAAMV